MVMTQNKKCTFWFVGLCTAASLCLVSSSLDLNTQRTPGGTQLPVINTEPLPPTFLPLCGNGKLDTIEDYQKLSAASTTFTAYDPQNLYAPAMQAQVFATETCDDGNRLDHDGCSADCMHRDLWVSSCQLQLDIPSQNLEAFVYVPAWDQMVLSTLAGLYSVNAHPAPGDMSLKTQLLVGKSFVVSNLFVGPGAGELFVYSNTEQKVWKYGSGALTLFVDLSDWLSTSSSEKGFRYPPPSPMAIFHDGMTVVGVDLSTGSRAKCRLTVFNIEGSVYLGFTNNQTTVIGVPRNNARIVVEASSGSMQCTELNSAPTQFQKDIWKDAMQALSNMLTVEPINYAMTVSSTGGTLPTPSYYRMYVPIGLWAETPMQSPRQWLARNSMQSLLLMPYIGSGLVMQAVQASNFQAKICSSNAKCMFDLSTGYDLLKSSSSSSAASTTWQSVLQAQLDKETISDFPSLYNNFDRYFVVLARFQMEMSTLIESRRLKDTLTHPSTGNLWALRSDGIYEVSKSGVQVSLPGGQCMPSGMALCPKCQWAVAGNGVCKPCSSTSNEWAWYVLCAGCKLNRRRALLDTSTTATTPIQFTVQGVDAHGLLLNASACGSETWTDLGNQTWGVRVEAEDPAACMRQLVFSLASINTVLVRPFISLELLPNNKTAAGSVMDEKPQETQQQQQLSVLSIAGIALGCTVALVALGFVFVHYSYTSHNINNAHELHSITRHSR